MRMKTFVRPRRSDRGDGRCSLAFPDGCFDLIIRQFVITAVPEATLDGFVCAAGRRRNYTR